jgi:hypothetical protein
MTRSLRAIHPTVLTSLSHFSTPAHGKQLDLDDQPGRRMNHRGIAQTSRPRAAGAAARALCMVPAFLLVILSAADLRAQPANMQPKALPTPLPYDIVYVRGPRFGDNNNTTWPEVFHPAAMDPGSDLMLLHPDGTEDVLVDCDVCSVVDPAISFDAASVYYTLFHDMENINNQRGLSYGGRTSIG